MMRSVRHLLVLLAMTVTFGVCAGVAVPAASAAPEDESIDFNLTVKENSELRIGSLPTFSYDGRSGYGHGTLTPNGAGYDIEILAENGYVPPLEMVPAFPQLPIEVGITTKTLTGALDPCSGVMTLDFDATFQPRIGAYRPALCPS